VAKTRLTGNYNLHNALAAAAVGNEFGLSAEKIRIGIESYVPSNLRSQWKETGHNLMHLDAYNANPSSMALAIRHFATLNLPKRVLILGDMFELGPESTAEHAEIVRLVRALSFDSVYLAGQEFYNCSRGSDFPAFPDTEGLLAELQQNPLRGCTILIKGSRGMKLEKSVDYL
jgi:UDP-N-acetylmuramoyl-tripeptide--D-alanyl-D-alanine ligase